VHCAPQQEAGEKRGLVPRLPRCTTGRDLRPESPKTILRRSENEGPISNSGIWKEIEFTQPHSKSGNNCEFVLVGRSIDHVVAVGVPGFNSSNKHFDRSARRLLFAAVRWTVRDLTVEPKMELSFWAQDLGFPRDHVSDRHLKNFNSHVFTCSSNGLILQSKAPPHSDLDPVDCRLSALVSS